MKMKHYTNIVKLCSCSFAIVFYNELNFVIISYSLFFNYFLFFDITKKSKLIKNISNQINIR